MKKKEKSNSRKALICRKKRLYKNIAQNVLLLIIIAATVFFLFSKIFFSLPKNEGYGMLTVLNNGDRVYVNRFGKPKRFSLIYFNQPDGNGTSIRRVIGLGGERVRYVNDELYINNQLFNERFLSKELAQAKIDNEMITTDFDSIDISETQSGIIPEGKYLVLGDNRKYSTDSRYYGLVDEKDIIGTVLLLR